MAGQSRSAPLFLPLGVAAPGARTGYVADSAGQIEAIGLSTGDVLWRAAVEARPLIVVEHRLAALRRGTAPNVLRIVVLDTSARGAVLLESDPIVFPDWVAGSAVGDESFRYRASGDGNDLLLEWEAQQRYRGGAAPPVHLQAMSTKGAAGIASIDLLTGRVVMRPAERPRDLTIPDAVQQAILFSYQRGATDVWQTEPWDFDQKLAIITGDIADHQTLRLQRWDPITGALDAPSPLITGDALVCRVTGDGGHLFIHSEHVPDDATRAESSWWVFSVATGRQIAKLVYEPVSREPCVLGSHVYFVVDAPASTDQRGSTLVHSTMRSVDLASGVLTWERRLSPRQMKGRPALRQ